MSESDVRSAQRVLETLSAYGIRYIFGLGRGLALYFAGKGHRGREYGQDQDRKEAFHSLAPLRGWLKLHRRDKAVGVTRSTPAHQRGPRMGFSRRC